MQRAAAQDAQPPTPELGRKGPWGELGKGAETWVQTNMLPKEEMLQSTAMSPTPPAVS